VPASRRYLIGGACVVVSSPDAPLLEERYPDYLPFLAAGDAAAGEAAVAIEARVGAPSLPPGARLLLEAGEAWSAHELAGTLFLAPPVFAPAAHPEWVAAVAPDRRRVTLTCAATLLAGEGERRRLAAPIRYPLDQILIALALAGEGLIVHAAAVQFGAGAVVLAGASGAGKTTIARICAAAGRPVLSDDRVIIRRSPQGWMAYGTPWPGEGKFAENRGLPLGGVVFLARGDESGLAPLPPSALARRLTPLATIPWFDPASRSRCLDLLADLASAVPVHELAFRPDAGAELALAADFGVATS
jgi:hypothetical protein